jgi:hypothetical protein
MGKIGGKRRKRETKGAWGMGDSGKRDQNKAAFLREAERMYDELHSWRAENLDASFDEIGDQVTPYRRVLVSKLLEQLAVEADERVEAPACEACGEAMRYRGDPTRIVGHREGEVAMGRAYYYCDQCGGSLFPPGPPPAVE